MPNDTEILAGQSLSLLCVYPGAVSLCWEKVGQQLAFPAVQMSGAGNSSKVLQIPNVDLQDSGQYLCVANMTDGQTEVSDAVSVAVLGKLTFFLLHISIVCIVRQASPQFVK